MLTGLLITTALAAAPPIGEGTHALFMRSATQARVPVLGERPGASEAWVLVEVGAANPEGAPARQTPCAVRMMGAGEQASVRLAPGFVEAMGTKQTHFDLTADEDGWSVEVDLGTDHIGYEPTHTQGAIPRRADDRAVRDHEGDGHPGGTVIIEVPIFGEMEIYIAQRARSSLHGRLARDGTLEGGIAGHELEQRTLAATHPLMRISPRMRTDPDRSVWWMVPVPADTTCATIADRACAIRGPGPGCPDGLADAQP